MTDVHADNIIFTADGDLTLAAPGTDVVGARISFTADGTLIASVAPVGRRRRVIVTDVFGTPYGECENAVLSGIDNELNQPETWSFQIPANDPKGYVLLNERFREVQVWRGDQLLAWGPIVRLSADMNSITANCRGALWHMTRRFIGGRADNWVDNGDFEDGLSSWGFETNGVWNYYGHPQAQSTPPDGQVVGTPTMTGRRALRLESFVNGNDAWCGQTFTHTVDETIDPDGSVLTIRGWVYVDSLDPGTGANENRGLYIERFSTTEYDRDPAVLAVYPGLPLSLECLFVPLNEDVPKNTWTRMEQAITSPPKAGEAEFIQIRLYAPNGVVYWDAISLTLVQRLVFRDTDQALIAAGIVEHLQDSAFGKSDVNIGVNTPYTGIVRTRIYPHSEHAGGMASLEEFTGVDDGFDYGIVYTPTTRTFRTYYPRRGDYKPAYALVLGTNIATYSYTFDGEAATSSVIVLGQGDGSDREEGSAYDTSWFSDDLTLEEVYSAPPETRVDALDNMARERLTVAKNPVTIEITTLPVTSGVLDPLGRLFVGDYVPVVIYRHSFQIDAVYRIVRLTINPDDTLSLTLNLRIES